MSKICKNAENQTGQILFHGTVKKNCGKMYKNAYTQKPQKNVPVTIGISKTAKIRRYNLSVQVLSSYYYTYFDREKNAQAFWKVTENTNFIQYIKNESPEKNDLHKTQIAKNKHRKTQLIRTKKQKP